jgi:hypothetical protein
VENSYLREEKAASQILSLKNKYMSYKVREYTKFLQQQAESIQNKVSDHFEQFLKSNKEVFRIYKKSGLSSPFVMMDFVGFIDKHFPQVVGELLSFDDYITSEEG